MEEIVPYESEIFYNKEGLRIWELRHNFVDDLLENLHVTKVSQLKFIFHIFSIGL